VSRLLDGGAVVIAAGFQGYDPDGNITTLGRGASDLTLFYLAYCLSADEVIKVTGVDGVYDKTGEVCKVLSFDDLNRIQKRSWVILPKAFISGGVG